LEAATPGKSLPSKEELLAFQARWLRRAGLAGLVGAFIVAAVVVLQQVGLNPPRGKSDAEQLVFEHAHSSGLIYSSILQALGLMAFVVPLLFLFRSANGRAARMRGAFAGLVVLGPLAFGLGLALSSVGSTKAADKFHDQEPAAVQQARQQAEQAQTAKTAPSKPAGKGKPTGTTTGAATTTGSTSTTASTTINLNGTTTTVATPVTPDQAGSNAQENLADHINKHTTLLIVGGLISTIGVLSLVFGMIYTNLWAMRTGLLSRFWSMIGIVAGVGLIILGPFGLALFVLWFAAIGLMFLEFWPTPLPPAWEAGEAVSWQRPGDDLGPPTSERGPAGTVEGSGREVSETPLPENGDGGGDQDQGMDQSGETQGKRRKKRKRRG
jgi:hypothetical protein